MAQDNKTAFTVTDSAARIFKQNPGLTLSSSDLKDLQRGALLPLDLAFPPSRGRTWKSYGCIRQLRYDSDTQLVQVSFDSGAYLNNTNTSNLGDFRQVFQSAANYGHGVTACFNSETRKLSMVNLHPCRCQCKCKGK